jgi:hypothetical protein
MRRLQMELPFLCASAANDAKPAPAANSKPNKRKRPVDRVVTREGGRLIDWESAPPWTAKVEHLVSRHLRPGQRC